LRSCSRLASHIVKNAGELIADQLKIEDTLRAGDNGAAVLLAGKFLECLGCGHQADKPLLYCDFNGVHWI
jgi:hypothetical protein